MAKTPTSSKSVEPLKLRPRAAGFNPNRIGSISPAPSSIPTGLCLIAQGCEARATLGCHPPGIPNRNAVAAIPLLPARALEPRPQPRWGWDSLPTFSQGSSCLATLGWRTESLWDSPTPAPAMRPAASSPGRARHSVRAVIGCSMLNVQCSMFPAPNLQPATFNLQLS